MAPWLRAAIDQMPIRLLYDLHRAARTHGDAVRASVAGLGDESVTLAEGGRFIAGLQASEALPVAGRHDVAALPNGQGTDGPAPGRWVPAGADLRCMYAPAGPPLPRPPGRVRFAVGGGAG